MVEEANSPAKQRTKDLAAGVLIFLGALLLFWFSPVHQVTDSHYSMLLSESLLKYQSFALDHFNLPRLQPNASTRDYYVMNGDIWQLELAGGHIYYYFPPGSSILSLPYVAIANVLGVSSANADGTYNSQGEIRIQSSLAALLMALLAVLLYFTSRLLLPFTLSVIVALTGVFGTQVWSTASRGLWSHTWASLLTAVLVWILLADETGRRKLNPILLATLLAWLYFVRPNGSIVVIAIATYIFLYRRRIFSTFAITGALWLVAFVTYSWMNFHRLTPTYYQASRLRFDLLPEAFAGNMVSPSRGLLIYVPAILFVIYLLTRYWRYLASTRLIWLAIFICVAHLVIASSFANLWGDWWGGASFGPRYTTELVPWFGLLAVLGLKARITYVAHAVSLSGSSKREPTQANSRRYIENVAGSLLIGVGIFINGRGALSLDTWKWSQPSTDRQLRAQLWDWKHPQFLAGLQEPAPPIQFPLVQSSSEIDFGSAEAASYLWYGWSGVEKDTRWTDGKKASIVFSVQAPGNILLELRLAPFLSSPQINEQTVVLKLNDHLLQTLQVSDANLRAYSVRLSNDVLRPRNILTFDLPDAVSPAALHVGPDDRLLGIRVQSMRFQLVE